MDPRLSGLRLSLLHPTFVSCAQTLDSEPQKPMMESCAWLIGIQSKLTFMFSAGAWPRYVCIFAHPTTGKSTAHADQA